MWQRCQATWSPPPGPPRNFQGDGAETKAAHARGQAGRGWRTPRKAARRLQSGSRAKRGQAGSSHRAPNEALGLDSGGKKVWEETKEQSRPSLCPYGVSPYLFCMTDRHKTIPKRHGALDTLEVQRAGARGVAARLGAGSAGFVQGGTKDAHVPVLGNLRPLESGVLGLGVFYCSLSSLCRSPG